MRGAINRVGAALVAVAAVGCGASGPGVVVEGTPPASPYGGPLDVPAVSTDDGHSPQALLRASGAAGRALECEGEIYAGGGPDGWSRSDGGGTPEEGLELYFDLFVPEVPRSGYRVERREGDRVLYSFDVAGRTKVAVVVAKDQQGRPGWGPETSAACDPSELPASFTADSSWYEIWTDRRGRRMPVAEISSSTGPEHCGWQSARFLTLGRVADGRTYVRDPEGVLDPELLTAPYAGDSRLPAGARDTGYRYGDWQLWLADDPTRAYVRTPDGVEEWPALTPGAGCR